MTILEVIQRSSEFLAKKGVDSPRLQTELLLAHLLKLPRMQLYLNFERVLAETEPGATLVRLRADLDRGGAALTHVLDGLVRRGALIVTCTRYEASLQEIFDMTVGEEAPGP